MVYTIEIVFNNEYGHILTYGKNKKAMDRDFEGIMNFLTIGNFFSIGEMGINPACVVRVMRGDREIEEIEQSTKTS